MTRKELEKEFIDKLLKDPDGAFFLSKVTGKTYNPDDPILLSDIVEKLSNQQIADGLKMIKDNPPFDPVAFMEKANKELDESIAKKKLT